MRLTLEWLLMPFISVTTTRLDLDFSQTYIKSFVTVRSTRRRPTLQSKFIHIFLTHYLLAKTPSRRDSHSWKSTQELSTTWIYSPPLFKEVWGLSIPRMVTSCALHFLVKEWPELEKRLLKMMTSMNKPFLQKSLKVWLILPVSKMLYRSLKAPRRWQPQRQLPTERN